VLSRFPRVSFLELEIPRLPLNEAKNLADALEALERYKEGTRVEPTRFVGCSDQADDPTAAARQSSDRGPANSREQTATPAISLAQ
jgi:hypothetical protein